MISRLVPDTEGTIKKTIINDETKLVTIIECGMSSGILDHKIDDSGRGKEKITKQPKQKKIQATKTLEENPMHFVSCHVIA